MTRRPGQIVLALALAAGALTGCARADSGAGADRTPTAGRTIAFDLYTHCGIEGTYIGSTWFAADIPLSDGEGNAGWGNPYQHGTMTLKSETEAVFTDDAGHEIVFHARPESAPKRLCA
ncbi:MULTISPECIES: hypothetical protein [unclassified Streptomyces]|uniref:hypothetical protein n=1 Tax=unclassified Streptomyces TaxID=2593676 RepID=UPI0006F60174|nr:MULTISPECIES: hypothetical protein [unclassified Streptomyces]KQX50794.1 hypothetical protein ASD33_12210 [Streptomyces sp. Root1304]KRA84959.1 hypothetical protein ASE09_12215 [Streptomyces sp. Root66D1]